MILMIHLFAFLKIDSKSFDREILFFQGYTDSPTVPALARRRLGRATVRRTRSFSCVLIPISSFDHVEFEFHVLDVVIPILGDQSLMTNMHFEQNYFELSEKRPVKYTVDESIRSSETLFSNDVIIWSNYRLKICGPYYDPYT